MGKEKYSAIFALSKTDNVNGHVSKVHPRTVDECVEGESMYNFTLSLTSAFDVGGWSTLRPGHWVCSWPRTPSCAEVKERVKLYLYSPSVSSWPVLGWIRTSGSCLILICGYVFGILQLGMSNWWTVNSIKIRINTIIVRNFRRVKTE